MQTLTKDTMEEFTKEETGYMQGKLNQLMSILLMEGKCMGKHYANPDLLIVLAK